VDDQYGPITIELTTDIAYDSGFMAWRADYIVVSGGETVFNNTYSSYTPTVVNSSGSNASYSFDDQGTFTTGSVLADSALIGDVSIVGNTISGVDSYGLADTLVVDGDLQLNGDLTSATDLSITVGGGLTTTQFTYGGAAQANWNGTTISLPSDLSNDLLGLIIVNSPAGSTINFTNYMYGSFSLTTTGTFSYNMPNNTYDVQVSQSNPYGSWNFEVNSIQMVTPAVLSTYGFGTNGALELPLNLTAPVDAATVVKWAKIVVAGQTYFTPLYQ
jgi:hypothetical protein